MLKIDKNKIKLISAAGLATCGKNSLVKIIQEYYDPAALEVSLAEPLRSELDNFLLSRFGISAYTQDKEQKSLIRPLLVSYANVHRQRTKGLYFIKKLHDKINKLSDIRRTIVISDLRFKTYHYDELDYCKENGTVIHIKKYKLLNKGPENIIKEYITPPNETEAFNDPIISQNADYSIEWPDLSGKGNYIEELHKFAQPTLDKIFKI